MLRSALGVKARSMTRAVSNRKPRTSVEPKAVS